MANLNGQSVMVTGGTGTFGRAFVRHVLENQRPDRLIIFSRGERAQAEMAREFAEANEEAGNPLRFLIGDVRDIDRLRLAMRNVSYVFHAAAMKRVETCEYNPQEAVQTNIVGTQMVIQAAIEAKVHRVLGISTDKAAAPTTLYGTTKAAMERLLCAGNALRGGLSYPKFASVRYGNVLGSNGSIFPQFVNMILEDQTLPVTDKEMTRFFWLPGEAIDFALEAMGEMDAGEVMIPKMRSLSVMGLIGTLGGILKKEPKFRVIGRRPMEKIHEVLITQDEFWMGYDHGSRFAIVPNDVKPAFGGPVGGDLIGDIINQGYHSGIQELRMEEKPARAMVLSALKDMFGEGHVYTS